jgi:prepilin-type N-terminal cleavage/methylation domain-containing protein
MRTGDFSPKVAGARFGFTLLELLTSLTVIAILAVMIIPAFNYLKGRAEKTNCSNNLKNLYAGANLYTQDHGIWPQIDPKTHKQPSYARNWQKALAPYGLAPENWVCPSVQRTLGNPDISSDSAKPRVDYIATPFGPKARAAYQWATQPWFIERGDMHGDGNLLIFADGQIKSLTQVRRDTQVQYVE